MPFFSLFRTSLSTMGGSIYLPKLTFAWEFGNYGRALSEYRDQILRSFGYAFCATVLCVLLAFPLAYVIAFKAGLPESLLGLVILPFFVTFLIRRIYRLEDHPGRQRLRGRRAGRGGTAAVRGQAALDELGGDRRSDLQLDHLHDPAALRQP